MGLTMCSMDVQFHKRRGGRSNIRPRDCWDFVRNLAVVIVSHNDPWGMHRIPKSKRKAVWLHYPDGIEQAASLSLRWRELSE